MNSRSMLRTRAKMEFKKLQKQKLLPKSFTFPMFFANYNKNEKLWKQLGQMKGMELDRKLAPLEANANSYIEDMFMANEEDLIEVDFEDDGLEQASVVIEG